MKTIKQFASQSSINEALIRAVIRQMGGFDIFKESAPDIANHGINRGFSGFIYYDDTVKFAKKHRKLIIDLGFELASECGLDGAYTLIASFNCLRDLKLTTDGVVESIFDKNHEDHVQVMNALAWFAGEEVARAYIDTLEN